MKVSQNLVNPIKQILDQTKEQAKTTDAPEANDVSLDAAAASGLNKKANHLDRKRKTSSKQTRKTGYHYLKRLAIARKNQSVCHDAGFQVFRSLGRLH